jgi:hypothetical protein
MTTKGRRGFKFTTQEIESLLDVIEEIIPIGSPDWEKVWDRHMVCYPKKEQTAKLLRCKFQELAKKNPTGDPNCPPHVCSAKRIYQLVVKAKDGLDGESGDDDVLPPNGDNANNDDVGDNDEDDKGDDEDDKADDSNGGLVETLNLSFENVSDFITEGVPREVGTAMRTSITVALLSAANRGGKKRSSAPKGGGGGKTKKSKALSKPLRIP